MDRRGPGAADHLQGRDPGVAHGRCDQAGSRRAAARADRHARHRHQRASRQRARHRRRPLDPSDLPRHVSAPRRLGVYPQEFADRIARSAGLRNILVHDYNDADRKIVHASITSCLRDYHRYVEYVRDFLDRLPA
ncbi:MAG: DUF86 domain-containing protein [Dehalococcoidia bacterium]|nr:DUF86 domain-containing protein [Dehalococcoidia bacterium]